MADALSTLQAQITAQLVAINATVNSSTVGADVKSTLVGSAGTLQQMLDKLLLGGTLTAQEQQTLTSNLDTSQKAILAQKAADTQTVIFVSVGAIALGVVIFLIVRHQKKGKT